MFCSGCGADNVSGAKFCRACGAALAQAPERRRVVVRRTGAVEGTSSAHVRARGGKRDATAGGVRDVVVGGGLLTTALVLAFTLPPGALMAWFFLFIFVLILPGLYMLGGGVAELLRGRRGSVKREAATAAAAAAQLSQASGRAGLRAQTTSELVPPPSVTEGTTTRLAQRRPRAAREETDE